MFFKRKGVGSSFNSVDEEKESKVVQVDLSERAEDEDYVSENKPLTPVEAKLKAIEEQKNSSSKIWLSSTTTTKNCWIL